MSIFSEFRQTLLVYGLVVTAFGATVVDAAMDPRFELDKQALEGSSSSAKPARKIEKRTIRTRANDSVKGAGSQGTVYVVKQGDHLFKILMRDFDLTNNEAEAFIEEVRRENDINDITRLRIGQKIIIPPVHRRAEITHRLAKPAKSGHESSAPYENYPVAAAAQTLRLETPSVPVKTSQEAVAAVKDVWGKMIPSKGQSLKPLKLQSSVFSLTLDPQRYPVFASMDGGTVLLDQDAAIPPLVKSLIEEKDPTIRIVSESPVNAKRFMSAMLEAGGFYSVENNFSMEFGTDPKLLVHSDFKVEKTAESLIKQDLVLLNSGNNPLPSSLGDFLKKEGFSVYEPFASLNPAVYRTPSRQLLQITSKAQTEILDAILNSLEVSYQSDRNVDAFAAENNGISLSVKAERFFERDGQRFVITSFDGDPVTYTLFRILETKGYRVVILEAKDDFRKISEKLLSRLRIKGDYAQHKLWPDDNLNYSLQMSGFSLEGSGVPGGSLFLTNLQLDRIIRDLLKENGYTVHVK